MAHWGMKMSASGDDVFTTADEDLLFTTKYKSRLVTQESTLDTTIAAGGYAYIAGVTGSYPIVFWAVDSGRSQRGPSERTAGEVWCAIEKSNVVTFYNDDGSSHDVEARVLFLANINV